MDVHFDRRRLRPWGALVAVATVCGACRFSEPPDVGTLRAVYARPAERAEVHRLAFGETLGGLLYEAIDANEQAPLLLAFSQHASPRRIREGTEITFRYRTSTGALRGVDVALNGDETVRLDRGPLGWEAEKIQTPVFVDTLLAAGTIETSLWNSVFSHPVLASMPTNDRSEVIDRLDRVFQWQMDFSRQIQQGDTYRFAFERTVRPDGSIRSGRLLAAEFVNAGTAYHAIWFDPNGDGRGSYFDIEGQSVRRAFLLKPIEYRRISSRFTTGRFHPILRQWRAHRGVDYAADTGTEIMATGDGVVIHRGWDGGYGNSVEIRHPNGWVTRYAHMSSFRRGVTVGTRVVQGQVIGYVGMTGLANGPHLHYEMLQSGQHKDPLSVDLPTGDPVPSADRLRWSEEKTARMALLDGIPAAGPVRSVQASVDGPQAGSGS